MSVQESIIDGISDNARTIAILGGGYIIAVEAGIVEGYPALPSLPGWWPIVALVAVAVGLIGWVVGGMIADLLPDPMGTLIVAFESHDHGGGAIYELNDKAFEEMHVEEGDLYPWEESPEDVYEARRYDPRRNVATANWRGTKTGSELATPVERGEVMRQIKNLRRDHEEEARYGKAVRNALPALLRTLDKWRAKDLNAALEDHISPNLGDRSIDGMISEQMPDEVLPDYMTRDSDEEPENVDDDLATAIEVVADGEALEPLGSPLGPQQGAETIVGDGGGDGGE